MFVALKLRNVFLMLAAVAAIFALPGMAGAQQDYSEAQFKAPAWEHNTTWNFGIYNVKLERIGTASYRVAIEPEMGASNYTIKYNAKSQEMAESSTSVVDKKTLLPVRSARKLTIKGTDYFSNTVYRESDIAVMSKRNNENPVEETFPAGSSYRLYDFEASLLLIPQIEWRGQTKVFFYMFTGQRRSTSWVFVEDLGYRIVTWKDKIWKCRRLSMRSDMGDQYVYTTIHNGRTEIAKYEMGRYTFINLELPSTGTVADLDENSTLLDRMVATGQ